MSRARPSVQKRLKEAKVHEKQIAKAARKAARDAARKSRGEVADGIDPDLIGLHVGPPVPVDEDDHQEDDVPVSPER